MPPVRMNPSANGGGNSVEDTLGVFDNLGLTQDELGLVDDSLDDDGGSDDTQQTHGRQQEQDDDDSEGGRDDRRGQPRHDDLDDLSDRRVSQTQQRRQPNQIPRRLPENAEVKPDAQGNLRDANGKLVASAGREARYYQNAYKATRDLGVTRGQLEQTVTKFNNLVTTARGLQAKVTKYEAADSALKRFGFTPDQQLTAMQYYSDLQKDPKATIRSLLTKAAARGINLQELGLAAGQGVDPKDLMNLIKTELDERMQPLKDREVRDQQNQQRTDAQVRAANEARAEVETFFTTNPEAAKFEPVFANLLGDPRFQGMSLEHIWDKIQLNLAQNPDNRAAYDRWQNGRDGQRQRRPNSSRQRSIPSGFSRPGNAGDTEGMAPVGTPYGDIVKAALADYTPAR